jgi:putative nucleotidyltransferase with HDIG domain
VNDRNGTSLGHLVKIDVDDLELGMYVSALDKPWLDSSFLFQGFELSNHMLIAAIKRECNYVYIDKVKENTVRRESAREAAAKKAKITYNRTVEDKQPVPKKPIIQQAENKPKAVKPPPVTGVKESKIKPYFKAKTEEPRIAFSPDTRPVKRIVSPREPTKFEAEVANARYVHHETTTVVKDYMRDIWLGKSLDINLAKQAVAECVDSLLQSPDALLWMTQMKNRDLYTLQHSLNVGVLAIALGHQLKLSVDELNKVGLCGMLHDVGKMHVPLKILNKPGRLDPDELEIMQSHPDLGKEMLLSTSGVYTGAIDAAYSHHERLDGTGYPSKRASSEISRYTRVVTIVDMYDAITSDRVYQPGRTHLDALKVMTEVCGTHIDGKLFQKLVEALGIYPAGSVLEFSSGEVGLVAEVNPSQRTRPKVILLLDQNKDNRSEYWVDLSKMPPDANGQEYKVKKMVRAEDYGIDLQTYYDNNIIEKCLASI